MVDPLEAKLFDYRYDVGCLRLTVRFENIMGLRYYPCIKEGWRGVEDSPSEGG